MIERLRYVLAEGTDPRANLALEERLLNDVDSGEAIIYLWQNERTVVIGRNQNAHAECNMRVLREDGGHLVRRLSGGGAVYHDLGNLNFTFLSLEEDESIERNLAIIARALQAFGLTPQRTGRNDLCLNGRKFSGNAFCTRRGHSYHHGTLMLNVDCAQMARYLSVSGAKLEKNCVRSVRSRVVNLAELAPSITTEKLKVQLLEAAESEYHLPAEKLEVKWDADFGQLCEKYASEAWNTGACCSLPLCAHGSFSWGQVTLHYDVQAGECRSAVLYSDMMDPVLPERINGQIVRCPWRMESLQQRLIPIGATPEQHMILADVLSLLTGEMP